MAKFNGSFYSFSNQVPWSPHHKENNLKIKNSWNFLLNFI